MKETLRFLAAWWCWTVLAFGQGGATFVPRTLPQLTDVADTATPTAGRILYGNGTAWTALAPGTTGQVLSINGSGLPIWSSSGGGVNEASDYDWTGTHTFGGTLTIGADGGITADGGLALTGYIDPTAGTLVLGNGTSNIDLSTATASGPWTFTGVPTIDAANEVKLSLTSDYDTFYLSAGTNTVSPQIDHTFLTLGHNIESTDAGLVPIVSTKPGWGLTLENNYMNPTSGSLQTEFYFGTANSERLMVGGIAPSATASVTSITADAAGSIVTISGATFTPNYLREGMRFYFTALPGTASGIDTATAYKVKTVIDATSFNLGTSATTPVAITGATYSGAAGTMNRGGWGSTSFYQPTSILLDATYGSTLKSPDIRDSTAFEVSVNLAGKHNYSYFTNGQASYGSYLALYGDANTEGWVMGAEPNVGFKIYRNAPTFGNNAMVIDFSNNIGFGNAAPLARLNPTSTTEQLRLSYDASNYAPFTVSSGGDLTIAPSGGDTTITGTLAATSLSGSGASLTGVNAATVTVADAAADTSTFPMLAGSATGSLAALTDAGLSYNASTNALTSTGSVITAEIVAVANATTINMTAGQLTTSSSAEALDWNNLALTGAWELNASPLVTDGILSGGTKAVSFTTLAASGDVTLSAAAGVINGGTGAAGSLTISSGTSGASRTLIFRTTTSGGTPTTALTLDGTQGATFAAGVTTASSGIFTFGSYSKIRSSAGDGLLQFGNNGNTAGTLLDLTTDGTIKLRNRANSADANITAANVTASGTLSVGTNATVTGNLTSNGALISVPQAISGASTAINVTTLTTTLVTTGGALTHTLADGTSGQFKVICMITDGGFNSVVTPTNFQGYTSIEFNDAGDSVTLCFLGTKWQVLSNNGATLTP